MGQGPVPPVGSVTVCEDSGAEMSVASFWSLRDEQSRPLLADTACSGQSAANAAKGECEVSFARVHSFTKT